jgi:1-acyl-sn-glycerol-3-phosphate acyltransferase
MSFLIQIKAIFVAFLLLGFVLIPACTIALPLPLRKRLKIVSPAWGIFARNFLKFGCQAKLDIWEDHRSEAYRGVPAYGLFVANHQSFIDIPLMATIYQIPPIMKKEVLYIPVFGWLAWASGAMPVSRSKNNSRKKVFSQARKRLSKEKIAVQVYPEGTRSRDGFPKEFSEIKKTLMVVAFNDKIPVIPTSLFGTRGVLSKKGRIQANRHLGIIVHKEIDPCDYATSDEFCQACWEKVREGYERMRNQIGHLNEK